MKRLWIAAALAAALCAPCRAKPREGLDAVVERKQMRKAAAVEKRAVTNGVATLTWSDGRVESAPIRRLTQPGRVAGAVDVALARLRLEHAAYKAAGIQPDAPAEVRAATLDALAAQAGKASIAKLLAAAAAGAAAALAAKAKKQKGTR